MIPLIIKAIRLDLRTIINKQNPNVITHISIDRHQFLYFNVNLQSHVICILCTIKAMNSDLCLIVYERYPNVITQI